MSQVELCASCSNPRRIQSANGYKWIDWAVDKGLPPRALYVGSENDGTPIYIGRTWHNNNLAPVKIVPSREIASICDGNKEVGVKNFDVLCGNGFQWVRTGDGHIPDGAVPYGKSSANQSIYIGRARHEDSLIPGRMDLNRGRLLIPYGSGEVAYQFYDILVHHQKFSAQSNGRWVQASSDGPVPVGAIIAGYDGDGTAIYVGRVEHEGNVIPAKIIPAKKMAHTQHQGQEISKRSYEALCDVNAGWVPFQGFIPSNAIECGNLANGEVVYIGRGKYCGTLTPGKVLKSTRKLQIPCDWKENTVDEFDVLVECDDQHCSSKYSDDESSDDESIYFPNTPSIVENQRTNQELRWVPGINRQPPPDGAVLAGHDSDGSPIYVGRVLYEGNQLPAKVIPRKQMCHSQFNGIELEMHSYEALCYGNVSWVRFRGTIPPNAIVCGRTLSGETVHIGRGCYMYSLTPGRVYASEKVLYLPHSWSEHRITDFEILIDENFVPSSPLKWVHTKRDQPAPEGTVIAGKDCDGATIYVGQVHHDGNRYVAKVIPSKGVCDTTVGGKVCSKLSYEALQCTAVSWKPFDGTIPFPGAVECGKTRTGERVFIGRAHFKSELIPGRVLETEKKLRIAYEQDEVVCDDYEILVLNEV